MENSISTVSARMWDNLRAAILQGLSNEFGFSRDEDDALMYEEEEIIHVTAYGGNGAWSAEVLGYRLDDFGLPVIIVRDEDTGEIFDYDERTMFFAEAIEYMLESVIETFCEGTPANYEDDDYVFLVECNKSSSEVFLTRAAAITHVRHEIMVECQKKKLRYRTHAFSFYTHNKGKVITHYDVKPKKTMI